MAIRRLRQHAALAASAVAAMCVTTGMAAGPDLEFIWEVDGVVVDNFSQSGTDLGGGLFNYQGDLIDNNGAWGLSWNLNGKPDPLLSGNVTVENFTNDTINFALTVILPTISLPDTLIGGSASIGLTTDSGGGTLGTVDDNPLWTVLMDGVAVESLFDAPYSLSNAGLGSVGDAQAFGMPIPSQDGPALNSDIAIRIEFSLTGNDQFSITSVFAALIPGPGALALFGMAGLAGRRRRRA